jgi:hypothetical protein
LRLKTLTLKLLINKRTSQRSIEALVEREVLKLEEDFSIPEDAADFHRFYTPLPEFFEVEFSDDQDSQSESEDEKH